MADDYARHALSQRAAFEATHPAVMAAAGQLANEPVLRVADLGAAAHKALDQFRADAGTADFAGPPRGGAGHQKHPDELEFASQGHTLLHVLEEVSQHLGQMELTRDVLRAAAAPG